MKTSVLKAGLWPGLLAGLGALLALLALPALAAEGHAPQRLRFVFGTGPVAAGEVAVRPDTLYTPARGHGLEMPGTGPNTTPATATLAPAVAGPRAGREVLAPVRPLYFSVDLPEGSYRVTATLGGTAQASDTTLKAELRRLVLQNVQSAPKAVVRERFTVHVRTPAIAAGPGRATGQVQLRAPRESVDEAWNWDGRLTLEINGARPVLQALDIEAVQVPLLFLLGDSTVADQAQEPYASWGQMLPRFFGPSLAVMSQAQSGETYRDALQRRRLDKILATGRPGDTVLMQYGHNDQKQQRDGSGSVASYQAEIRQHVQALRAAQMLPVIVTSVERRFFEADGSLRRTLGDHVAAAQAVATELKVPLIDLNASSRALYMALGPTLAPSAFALQADGKVDATHHNNYGAWLLAGLVAQGLREQGLPVARHLRSDAPLPRADQPPTVFAAGLAPSPNFTRQRPAGDVDTAATAAPVPAPTAATNTSTPTGTPASTWSTERAARLDAAVKAEIAAGRLAGGIVHVQQHGRVVHQGVFGQADLAGQQPLRADALFRIASMSKAVTTVAAMLLYEEGHFLLRDPIAKWLPAFTHMQVAVPGAAGQPPRLEKARRPITVRDLLLHTAGLSYGAGPAEAAWRQAGFSDWYILGQRETLAQWTDRLAQLPLQAHPGEVWQYGYSTDVLGRLIELWSGQPLDQFVAQRITGPLRMPDTNFWVPPEKAARLANVYGLEKGRLLLQETAARSDFVNGPRQLPSGGAGLVSTVGDYARFLQMLLNGGQLDGVRLLNPATVALMQRDHTTGRISGYGGDGEASGFGFWLQKSPGSRSELGSEGAYGWGSAYAPQYVVDPATHSLFIFMTQLRPAGDSTLNQRVKVLARQALME